MSQRDPHIDIKDAEEGALKRIKEIGRSVLDKAYCARLLRGRGAHDIKQTKKELELWLKFNLLAKDQDKITLELIDKLEVEYDVLFILGKKGIGKTWMVKELLHKADEAGDWVIVGRNRLCEVKTHWVESFNHGTGWLFTAHGGSDPITLYSKKFLELHSGKGEFRGYAVPLKGSAKFFGPDYEKLKYIIFDEVVSHKTSVITSKDMKLFIKFLNSTIRSKKGVKAYFLGNLLPTEEGSVEQEFMKCFNVTPRDNLKYISVDGGANQEPVRMLYINTRDLFIGIGDEGGAAELGTDYQHKDELQKNTIEPTSPLVLSTDYHAEYKIFFSIVVHYKNTTVAVVMRIFEHNEQTVRGGLLTDRSIKYYACSVVGFQPYLHNVNCYTNLLTVARSFPASVRYRTDDQLKGIWEKVIRIMNGKRFMFGNESGYTELDNIMNKYYKNDELSIKNLSL